MFDWPEATQTSPTMMSSSAMAGRESPTAEPLAASGGIPLMII